MKKSIFLLTLFFMVSFSLCAYETSKEKNVNMSENVLKNNNVGIERAVQNAFSISSYPDSELRGIIKKNYNLWESDKESDVEFILRLMKTTFSNTKYEIKNIRYISETDAIVSLDVIIPDYAKMIADGGEEKIESLAKEKFKQKTGKTLESLNENSPISDFDTYLDIYFQIFADEGKKVTSFNTIPNTLEARKENGIWIFKDQNFNFF